MDLADIRERLEGQPVWSEETRSDIEALFEEIERLRRRSLVPKALKRAWKRLRAIGGRPAPEDPLPSTEESARGLLEAFGEEIEKTVGTRKSVDRELYVQGLLVLLEDARLQGRRDGTAALVRHLEDDCACLCRSHNRSGCPHCLHVDRCPVHSDPDENELRIVR